MKIIKPANVRQADVLCLLSLLSCLSHVNKRERERERKRETSETSETRDKGSPLVSRISRNHVAPRETGYASKSNYHVSRKIEPSRSQPSRRAHNLNKTVLSNVNYMQKKQL